MNLLIPYVKLPDHNDPLFEEFTYGDRDQRARKLMTLKPGDRIFFHTTLNGKKCITAYYDIARVMETRDVVENPDLLSKFKSPHISRWLNTTDRSWTDDVMVFGDPITSRILAPPLLFNRQLASKLSLRIAFPPERTDSMAIGSATRSWRHLSDDDVNVLRAAMRKHEASSQNFDNPLIIDGILTTEEVSQVIEKHIEALLAKNPKLLNSSVTSVKRQVETDEGRIDLLLEIGSAHIVVVEVKLHRIGRNAVQQLRHYMKWIKKGARGRTVSGVIVCEGILPAFIDDMAKLKDIEIFCYGWQLKLRQAP